MKRKICVVTGTRAEFGVLYWLIKSIEEDNDLELQLIVTGMHLSPEFGLTYQSILDAGLSIDRKIEILLSSDTPIGIAKSMGLAHISFGEAFDQLRPDLVVILGDRFEMLAVASVAMVSCIPIAHIHGGETTEGLIDEAIRHAITKMAHLHFTSTEVYRKRVIQLGEQPDKVFNVGAPGLDNIYNLDLLSKEAFEQSIDFELGDNNILVTFHPVTLEQGTAPIQFQALLDAIESMHRLKIIFTKPNADTGGRIIIQMIDDYVAKHLTKACAFTSLGQLRYLSSLQYMDAVVGNSSSGIVEVATFKKPAVNIGDRQKGRIKSDNVIDCSPTKESIEQALKKAFSVKFKKKMESLKNVYGTGGASGKIKEILKIVPLDNLLKKKFYDLDF